MDKALVNWLYFILLSIIWGSSFILMKEGLRFLSPFQVASIRIVSAGIVLLPVTLVSIRHIPPKKILLVFLSGAMGSLVPAYLFCLAEQGIDSSLAGTLNSLTPIFVILAGAFLFKTKTTWQKISGILIAFAGTVFLFFSQPGFEQNTNLLFILFVVLATCLYGINVNMVHQYLHDIPSLRIASVALSLNAIPALIVLFLGGYFTEQNMQTGPLISAGFSSVLGVIGTAMATVIFYVLMKRAGAVFASMVTYGIPIVAIAWGIIYGEDVGWKQILGMGIILAGVWVANRKRVAKSAK